MAQTIAVLLLLIDLSGRFKGKWHGDSRRP
jgi:hypothetical protein